MTAKARGSLEILEGLPAGVLVYREEGSISFVNRRAREILEEAGCGRATRVEEIFGFRPHEVADPEGRTRNLLPRGRAGLPLDLGYQVRRLRLDDSEESFVVVFQDISEVVEQESARARLLGVSTVSRMLPTLAHELFNPLAGVHSLLEVLAEEVEDARQQADLRAALTEIDRIYLLVRGLGVAASSLQADADECDVTRVVTAMTELYRGRAASAGVSLQTGGTEQLVARVDRDGLRLVLSLLITNALEFSRRGDTVTVACAPREPGFELSVVDTGNGMSAESLARATDLFFTTQPGKAGIGLTLVREVMHKSGGELVLESEEGRGTSATLLFPGPEGN